MEFIKNQKYKIINFLELYEREMYNKQSIFHMKITFNNKIIWFKLILFV
jgi:hypothetical protein